jgi:hypothetical protein
MMLVEMDLIFDAAQETLLPKHERLRVRGKTPKVRVGDTDLNDEAVCLLASSKETTFVDPETGEVVADTVLPGGQPEM